MKGCFGSRGCIYCSECDIGHFQIAYCSYTSGLVPCDCLCSVDDPSANPSQDLISAPARAGDLL